MLSGRPSGEVFQQPAKDIILECTYQSTVILKDGSMSKTAGTKLLTIKRIKDTQIILFKEGLGAEFRGTISESEIFADTAFQIDNLSVKENFKINRYTGQFENSFYIGSGGLMHLGECSSSQRKF
jgi:hypothetical protein